MKLFNFCIFVILQYTVNGCLVVNKQSTTTESTTVGTSTTGSFSSSSSAKSSESTTSGTTTDIATTTKNSTESTTSETTTDIATTTSAESTTSGTTTDIATTTSAESTTSGTTTDIATTTSAGSSQSTVSHSTGSSDHTTTISTVSTTEPACKAFCNNPDNILINDDTSIGKPSSFKLPDGNPGICGTFFVSCDAESGKTCESIQLFASQPSSGQLLELSPESQVSVSGIVECTGNGNFRMDGIPDSNFYDMFCMFKNCKNETETTTVATSTVVSTTEPKSCSTCEISKLFDYANVTEKFQPWYFDIETPDNCLCKGYDVSCELYDVDTCDFHNLMYLSDDNQEYALVESTSNKVNGQIYCQNNGEFGVDGRNIKEIYCRSSNCRVEPTVPPTTTVAPTCRSCDVPSLFKYTGDTSDFFQPWYRDIDGGDCNCKFNELSCELFGNITCESFELQYHTTTNSVGALAVSTTNKVVGQIDCKDNGRYMIGTAIVDQVFCIKIGCT